MSNPGDWFLNSPNRVTIASSVGPVAIFRRFGRTSDVHKSGDALICGEAESLEHTAIVCVPFGDPACRIAHRMRGKDQAHRGSTSR